MTTDTWMGRNTWPTRSKPWIGRCASSKKKVWIQLSDRKLEEPIGEAEKGKVPGSVQHTLLAVGHRVIR